MEDVEPIEDRLIDEPFQQNFQWWGVEAAYSAMVPPITYGDARGDEGESGISLAQLRSVLRPHQHYQNTPPPTPTPAPTLGESVGGRIEVLHDYSASLRMNIFSFIREDSIVSSVRGVSLGGIYRDEVVIEVKEVEVSLLPRIRGEDGLWAQLGDVHRYNHRLYQPPGISELESQWNEFTIEPVVVERIKVNVAQTARMEELSTRQLVDTLCRQLTQTAFSLDIVRQVWYMISNVGGPPVPNPHPTSWGLLTPSRQPNLYHVEDIWGRDIIFNTPNPVVPFETNASSEYLESYAKAKKLFLSHLTPEQRAQVETEGYVDITAASGLTYRLHTTITQQNIYLLNPSGVPVARYCTVPKERGIPEGDIHLSQLLLLLGDEEEFLRRAVREIDF